MKKTWSLLAIGAAAVVAAGCYETYDEPTFEESDEGVVPPGREEIPVEPGLEYRDESILERGELQGEKPIPLDE